jgi:alanine racemase
VESPQALIDLAALKHNFDSLAYWQRSDALPLMPVVKANAYGHGAVPIALYLEKEFSDERMPYLCVARWSEAIELRRAGLKRSLLVLSQFSKKDLDSEIPENIFLLVASEQDISLLESLDPDQRNLLAGLHLDFDTGMNRLGFKLKDSLGIAALIDRLSRMGLAVNGLSSHLARAEEDPLLYSEAQIKKFDDLLKDLKKIWKKSWGVFPRWIHMANSAGQLFFSSSHFLNAARTGLMLWGVYTDLESEKFAQTAFGGLKLKPLMRLRAAIKDIFDVESGEGLSYGHRFIAPQKMTIGVIHLGYADGLSRLLSRSHRELAKLFFEIEGHSCPIVGTVTMDMTLVDLSDHPQLKSLRERLGRVETLWADWISEKQSATQIAHVLKTISYEILCDVGHRVQRHYNQNSDVHSAT